MSDALLLMGFGLIAVICMGFLFGYKAGYKFGEYLAQIKNRPAETGLTDETIKEVRRKIFTPSRP